jgi:hypothetical protein
MHTSVASSNGFGEDQPRTVDAAAVPQKARHVEMLAYQLSIIKAINALNGRDR